METKSILPDKSEQKTNIPCPILQDYCRQGKQNLMRGIIATYLKKSDWIPNHFQFPKSKDAVQTNSTLRTGLQRQHCRQACLKLLYSYSWNEDKQKHVI